MRCEALLPKCRLKRELQGIVLALLVHFPSDLTLPQHIKIVAETTQVTLCDSDLLMFACGIKLLIFSLLRLYLDHPIEMWMMEPLFSGASSRDSTMHSTLLELLSVGLMRPFKRWDKLAGLHRVLIKLQRRLEALHHSLRPNLLQSQRLVHGGLEI